MIVKRARMMMKRARIMIKRRTVMKRARGGEKGMRRWMEEAAIPEEGDVGVSVSQHEAGAVTEQGIQPVQGLPALDRVVAAAAVGLLQVPGQWEVVLQQEAHPVHVHPALPTQGSEVAAASERNQSPFLEDLILIMGFKASKLRRS